MSDEIKTRTLYEGDNFAAYRVEDDDGDAGYEFTFFNNVTVHFLAEEWNEFLAVVKKLKPEPIAEDK